MSYHAPNGGYSVDSNYFAGGGVSNPPLRALADGEDGGNGVYRYGNSGFPNETYNASFYWVDLVFQESVGPDTTPPTISSVSPSAGAAEVSPNTRVSVVFNELMDATTINSGTVVLRDDANTVVPATVSYNTFTAELTPADSLNFSTTYTVTVVGGPAGVTDLAGNPLGADYQRTFTTGTPDATPPAVVYIDPRNDQTDISLNAEFFVRFSEPVNPSTITGSNVFLMNSAWHRSFLECHIHRRDQHSCPHSERLAVSRRFIYRDGEGWVRWSYRYVRQCPCIGRECGLFDRKV